MADVEKVVKSHDEKLSDLPKLVVEAVDRRMETM